MKRSGLFVVFVTMFCFIASTEAALAQITFQLPGFKSKSSKSNKNQRSPDGVSHAKWHTSLRNGVDVAQNDQGVMISLDDRGELIFVLALKYPSGKTQGTIVPVEVLFNNKHFGIFDGVQLDGRLVGLSGSVVHRLIDRFKRSRKFEINVAGNMFSSHLRGSTRAIKHIERVAKARRSYLMKNAGAQINDARVKYMITRHKNKTRIVAANQVLNNQKRNGIRNDNIVLNKSMRQENAPKTKVQYFVPGTKTIGEMWIESDVVAKKGLVIKLNFVDPGHPLDKVARTTQLLPGEAETMATLLARGEKWTTVAQKNKVGRFDKTIGIVSGNPELRELIAINFNSYEDGSTAVQVEEMIAGYPKRFNFAIQNGLELATYLHEVVKRSKQDFKAKRMSKKEKNELFN